MSLVEVHGPHLAEPGSASALWFGRAAEHYAAHEAAVDAAREDGTLTQDTGRDRWCAARVAEREGTEAPGYIGRDFDPAIADDARYTTALLLTDALDPADLVAAREMLVRAGIASGDSEPRARRSVIDGLMRALNPPGGIKGGLYRAPVEPPNPTEPKRCA
jgi:hypothetical protein